MSLVRSVSCRPFLRFVRSAKRAGCEYRRIRPLQPKTDSVKTSFALRDAHMGSALVRDVVIPSGPHEIWLQQNFV